MIDVMNRYFSSTNSKCLGCTSELFTKTLAKFWTVLFHISGKQILKLQLSRKYLLKWYVKSNVSRKPSLVGHGKQSFETALAWRYIFKPYTKMLPRAFCYFRTHFLYWFQFTINKGRVVFLTYSERLPHFAISWATTINGFVEQHTSNINCSDRFK